MSSPGASRLENASLEGRVFQRPSRRGICTLAFSRVLDTDEVLVAMNLDVNQRNDCVTVDRNLNPAGRKMVDILNGGSPITVEESGGRAFVRVPLQAYQIAILKAV